MASIATSIMLLSGSWVVKFCSHIPGQRERASAHCRAPHQAVELIGNAHYGHQQQQLHAHTDPHALPVDVGNTRLETMMDTMMTTNKKLVPQRG